MKSGVLDIDHLMVCVHDSQKAGESFEKLGFTVTPRSELPGLSNRLICFEAENKAHNNFIELMAWGDRSQAPALMNDILTDTEQPVSMVMASGNARATGEVLQVRGFEPYPALELQRDWALPGGDVITPKFVVSIPKAGKSPLYWNVCEYKNPELYRRPEFLGHPNDATQLADVLAVASDPQAVAAHYVSAWDASIKETAAGLVAVSPGRIPLVLMAPETAESQFGVSVQPTGRARYLGFSVSVKSLDQLRKRFSRDGVAFKQSPSGTIATGPVDLHGCLVQFIQET